jgi:hypothetical protein
MAETDYWSNVLNWAELNLSWEATSRSATQEFLSILWNPKGSLPCLQEPCTGPYPEPDDYENIQY